MKKRTKELKKVDLETILLGAKISNVMHAHIINIFDELDDNQVFGSYGNYWLRKNTGIKNTECYENE